MTPKLTDRQAYKIFIDYCGGEKGLLMTKEMIHVGGLETAIKNMMIVFDEKYASIPSRDKVMIKNVIKQALAYIEKEMNSTTNEN